VWEKAFQKLGTVNENDVAFDRDFLEETKEEIKHGSDFDLGNMAEEINKPIDYSEVVAVIAKQKNGKAAGIDGLVSEIIKYGGDAVSKATWRLCEEMFRVERIPRDWARGLIFPLHKEGDARAPDNYRGITLLSVVGKIYAMVLNNRVKKWCEERNVLVDEQAGFRMGRSTIDQTFILSELIRMRRKKGLKTYCAFLDIKKAYDTVWRDGLWKRLLEVGLKGKMWRVLRNLYAVVESCVLLGPDRTEWFPLHAGLRQGCILSPILFAIFIDGLARVVKDSNTGWTLDNLRLNILLFADDLVLIGNSREELQKLLDMVFQYSEKWRFEWNTSKSKVVIFRGRGLLKKKEVFYLGLAELEIVQSIKYLGTDFKFNLSWTETKLRLLKKARGRLAIVRKAAMEGLSLDAIEGLWIALIRPIIEYGCEIWGAGNWPAAEQVQREVGRKLLGMSSKAKR